MIETGQLTKAYGDVAVVDGVSLQIPAGGVTAIIGPNGAGKSTFLSMVARLTPMSSGVVTVGGWTYPVRRATSWQSGCRSSSRTTRSPCA